MARRRKDDDWIWAIPQVVGLFIALGFVYPPVHQVLLGMGFIAICVIGVAVVGLVGFGVYRFTTRSQRPQAVERNVDWKALGVNVKGETQTQPQTTMELIERLRLIDWFQFEKMVELVYRKLGYSVIRRGGANPDGGIDLIIEKDGQRAAVQCKQWKTWNVGVKAVREFLGALTHAKIQRGIFVTLRGYTGDAKRFAEEHEIEILNETGLAKMLEDAGAKFDPETIALLNDTRKFCPKCEREMELKTATRGPGAGRNFWGCSAYPRCHYTMNVR